MTYRPLINISNQIQKYYLPNNNAYNAAQTAKIKKFIPKIFNFVGVDVQADSEEKRQELSKQKLKVRSVQGKEIDSKNEITFYKKDELVMKIWENVPICVNIPFNNRQNAQDEKQQLQSKIEKYIDENILCCNSKGQILQKNQNIIDLSDLSIFFNPCEMASETFDNSYRQLRVILSVGVIVQKRQSYTVGTILDVVKEDIVNSIKIMVKNKLSIRIVRAVFRDERVMILQSFVGKMEEVANQQKKLDQLLNKDKANKKTIQKQSKQQEKVQMIQKGNSEIDKPIENLPRKDLSNRQLMLILLGLFFIYIFLKINPLEKMITESL